jgi:hypothetical protein
MLNKPHNTGTESKMQEIFCEILIFFNFPPENYADHHFLSFSICSTYSSNNDEENEKKNQGFAKNFLLCRLIRWSLHGKFLSNGTPLDHNGVEPRELQ